MKLQMQKQFLFILLAAAAITIYQLQSSSDKIDPTPTPVSQGIPDKMIAGEVHYSRIPVEYWEHRLLTIKSLGFNSLSIYIMWNYHQVEKGKFDFTTGNKNISKFLDLSQRMGFKVLIRPGPYVCAEWDFGGMPARLLAVPGIKLRANNAIFLAEVQIYFAALEPVLRPFLEENGGPIILLQIQNEYGFYGDDKTYMEAIRKIWYDLKFECASYYVDTAQNIQKCHWNGANIGINNGITEPEYKYARTIQKDGVIFGGQIYSGWLTHWGENWQGKTLEKYMEEFTFLYSYNHSFSMYMVHGGSNFGLTAGANSYSKQKYDYRGHVTSYDYEAPIGEQGDVNEKFWAFRNLSKRYVTWEIPEPPAPLPVIEIPSFLPFKIASLFANLPAPAYTKSRMPYLFESAELQMFNQGFVLYETTLDKKTYFFKMVAHDFAIVYLDGKLLGTFDRSESTEHTFTVNCSGTCKLSILVEAMGHINFDHPMEFDRKGLFSFTDSYSSSFSWDLYKIPIDENLLKWRNLSGERSFPLLARGTVSLANTGDTFLNMKNFKKGYVWVNGKNLGRYWSSKGPQQKLFCPGVWLIKGYNEIMVLEVGSDQIGAITGEKTLK